MSFPLPHQKHLAVILLLIASVFLWSTCIQKQDQEADPAITLKDGNRLVGSASCRSCHQALYDSFVVTGHNLTSKPALKKYIKGSFEKGKNLYNYSAYDAVLMADLDTGLYQIEYRYSKFYKAYRFDMVIGSGTRGQTYLRWEGNRLFQLPVSYYTPSNTWSNSPNYPDVQALFTRSINGECLGCHNGYASVLHDSPNGVQEFDPHQIVYGVNCERCHGPGGKHVDFYTAHKEGKDTTLIVNAARLTQRQQLDACAICHSSGVKGFNERLGFKTGDTMRHQAVTTLDTSIRIDVHGNQYGLLVASKCFRLSPSMTCSSCHNTHQQERGNLAVFSKRCMNCHQPDKAGFCKMAQTVGRDVVMKNCIDCHMPQKDSKALNVKIDGEMTHKPASIRTHFIAVYPDATQKQMQHITVSK